MSAPVAGDPCPRCGVPLVGLARRCWAGPCEWPEGTAPQQPENGREEQGRPKPRPVTSATLRSPSGLFLATLPWAALVSVNVRAGAVSRTSKEWREGLAAMRDHLSIAWAGREPLTGPVSVRLWLSLPDGRKRDAHNLQKALLDAMEGLAFENDFQVVDWSGVASRREVDWGAFVVVSSVAGT